MRFELTDYYFTEKINLQRPTIVQDDLGGSIRTWDNIPGDTGLFASIQPIGVMEASLFGSRTLGTSHVIFVRSEPNFKRGDRVSTLRGFNYRILGIRNSVFFDSLWVIDVREILV